MAAALALLSSLSYGIGDFFGGLAARRTDVTGVVWRTHAVGLVLLLVVAPTVGGTLAGADVVVGAVSGLAGGLAIAAYYRAMTYGAMSVVTTITALVGTVFPVVHGLVQGERPPPLAGVGIVVAILAIGLVSTESLEGGAPARSGRAPSPPGSLALARSGSHSVAPVSDGTRRRRISDPLVVGYAVASGVGFGLFFVVVAEAGDGAGLWPLLVARACSTGLFTIIVLRRLRARRGAPPVPRTRPPWVLLVATGVLDVAANAAYLLATRRGLLSVVSVIAALYPAGTVILARVVLGERLLRHQQAGLALAGGAVALVALA